jgi:hypothetical protein
VSNSGEIKGVGTSQGIEFERCIGEDSVHGAASVREASAWVTAGSAGCRGFG